MILLFLIVWCFSLVCPFSYNQDMTSTIVVNLHKILEHDDLNIYKGGNPASSNGRKGADNSSNHNNHHHHHKQKSDSKVKLNLDFPVVVTLVRNKLDVRSRALLENSKQLQLLSSSPASSTSSSSSSPSSSSSSLLHDSGALLMILNELDLTRNPQLNQVTTASNNNNNINNHQHLQYHHQHQPQNHFVVENVGHVDLLFGEELYRKSSDGSLGSTGRKLEIPKHFEGWFEILSQDGRSSQQITDVTSLVKKNVRHFLLTKPTKALAACRKPADAAAVTAPSDYKQVTLSVGHEVHWSHVVTLSDGLQCLSCRLKHFKRKDGDDKREEEVLLPLAGQGRFLPISRDSNLTDAHDATFLMTRLYMPLVVRVYWPPNSKNIPHPTMRNVSAKVWNKKIGFFQKRSLSSPRIEPTTPGPVGGGECMASTIVRIHGHARQKVLYLAPISIPQDSAAAAAATADVLDDLKVVALRSQACRFFDVALENKFKPKQEILDSLKKKRLLLQAAFEREVKIFDTTLYKMTGEKLTVNKQPINVAKEIEVINHGERLDGNVVFRQHEPKAKESVAKRRSLPPDVTLERRDKSPNGEVCVGESIYDRLCDDPKDDESVLMNEIESIYMRVRYWDRSVRYPMPQKPVAGQPPQSQKSHVAQQQVPLPQRPPPMKPKQTPDQQQVQVNSISQQISKPDPSLPPRIQQQLPPVPPQPRQAPAPIAEQQADDSVKEVQPLNDSPTAETTTTAATTPTTAAATAPSEATQYALVPVTKYGFSPAEAANNNNKIVKGAVRNVLRNLVKKNKGSIMVTKPAENEFSYFHMQKVKH